MQFTKHDLGRVEKGSTVVVTLKGNAANVRLMTSSQFNSYRAGRRHQVVAGGLVKRSPARLRVPRSDRYVVAVDLAGLGGKVTSSVVVEPPPLPVLRQPSQSPLTAIRHAPPPAVTPTDEPDETPTWDVFVSHASEDAAEVAAPLAEHLQAAGATVWLDTLELRIGDSLRRKIDEGLARSRFGVVVLSPHFFAKGWTQYELDGLVTRDVAGEQSLLPVWHNVRKDEVMSYSPSLADKVARSTGQYTVEEIALEIAELVLPDGASGV